MKDTLLSKAADRVNKYKYLLNKPLNDEVATFLLSLIKNNKENINQYSKFSLIEKKKGWNNQIGAFYNYDNTYLIYVLNLKYKLNIAIFECDNFFDFNIPTEYADNYDNSLIFLKQFFNNHIYTYKFKKDFSLINIYLNKRIIMSKAFISEKFLGVSVNLYGINNYNSEYILSFSLHKSHVKNYVDKYLIKNNIVSVKISNNEKELYHSWMQFLEDQKIKQISYYKGFPSFYPEEKIIYQNGEKGYGKFNINLINFINENELYDIDPIKFFKSNKESKIVKLYELFEGME